MTTTGSQQDQPRDTLFVAQYDPPTLTELGNVHDLTLGCFWGKKWGGTDGLQWMGINIPVSSC
jgi:hypothetical protein